MLKPPELQVFMVRRYDGLTKRDIQAHSDSTAWDDEDKECRKIFQAGGGRTGGVITIFCGHDVCYSAIVIQEFESRDHVFSYMTKYLEKAPKYLIYDVGCAALDYCVKCLPDYFNDMAAIIDKPLGKSQFLLWQLWYGAIYIAKINSQTAEQINSYLKKMIWTLHRCNQLLFVAVLRQYLHVWNERKNKKMEKDTAINFNHRQCLQLQ